MTNIIIPNKWPALLVQGKKVTKEQAIEINFRTCGGYLSTNDENFLTQLAECFGVGLKGYGYFDYEELDEKLHLVELEYLSNQNICSSWVGGVHGWCNWEGNIFSNNSNIGKWPSFEEVETDWKNIATAFPFLDIRCQLLNHEAGCEGEEGIVSEAIVEFVVKDGKVEAFVPSSIMIPSVVPDFRNLFKNEGEHPPFHVIEDYYKQFVKIMEKK